RAGGRGPGAAAPHAPSPLHPPRGYPPLVHTSSPAPPDPGERLRGDEFALLTTTQFFGREAETEQLSAMLAAPRNRLVTLTGPGGTGKTRLALELAARLVVEGGEVRSAVFLPLADLADPARLLEVVLRGLEFAPVLG